MGNPENQNNVVSAGFTLKRRFRLPARTSLTILVYFFACAVFPLPGQDITTERDLALQTPEVFFTPDESLYSRTQRMSQGIPGIERASNGRFFPTVTGFSR
jgi:hypothetical protein